MSKRALEFTVVTFGFRQRQAHHLPAEDLRKGSEMTTAGGGQSVFLIDPTWQHTEFGTLTSAMTPRTRDRDATMEAVVGAG
ncbi:hypothetical protein ABZX92_39420 [Lentzea sp. NPDC006480]|uniref:hypothetical protein n=1 Tax=Lentzea sp. NPDC006480 TaxID=3157176 RepID=UPI0033AF9B2D